MEKKERGRRNSGGKEKKKSSAGFKPVRLVLLVFLPVEQEGVVGKDWFHLSTSLSQGSSLLSSLQSSSSGSFCSPLGL